MRARGEVITYHVRNSEVGVGSLRHAQGIVAHPCLTFWKPFPQALRSNVRGVRAIRGKRKKAWGSNHTILGRSFSSFACSYSVSMLRAERKKSVGCEISKRDDRDMASIAKRCVLCKSTINIQRTHPGGEMNVGRRTSSSSLYY
jgi:hypothetical protein